MMMTIAVKTLLENEFVFFQTLSRLLDSFNNTGQMKAISPVQDLIQVQQEKGKFIVAHSCPAP